MDKLVLIETIQPKSHPLSLKEGKDGGKLVLEGIAIQGEVRNQNGRVYPKGEIEAAVKQLKQTIDESGPVIGECDHPEGLNINLDRATHLITDIWMNGNDGHAKMEVVQVGLGEIVSGLIKQGARLGVSSRGSGNVDNDGNVSDFDIVTIDIVANPSAPDAYPNAVFESLLRDKHGREAMTLTEALKHDPSAQKYFEREIVAFLTNLQPSRGN